MHTYIRAYIHIHTYMHTLLMHTYIHTYLPTYIHTYIHTKPMNLPIQTRAPKPGWFHGLWAGAEVAAGGPAGPCAGRPPQTSRFRSRTCRCPASALDELRSIVGSFKASYRSDIEAHVWGWYTAGLGVI